MKSRKREEGEKRGCWLAGWQAGEQPLSRRYSRAGQAERTGIEAGSTRERGEVRYRLRL
jgi:hypothetical protein